MQKIPVTLVFILLLSAQVFSQEQGEIPSVQTPEEFLQAQIDFGTRVLEKGGYLDVFQVYDAVRKEDLSLCPDELSRKMASDLLMLRYSGENRCKDIQNQEARGLCELVNAGSCDSADGWRRDFCQALEKSDDKALREVIDNKETSNDGVLGFSADDKSVLLGLGVYHGFKYYSPIACERFVKQAGLPLSLKISCRMLFYPDFEKEKERLVKDLSLFVVARTIPQPALCEQIDETTLKDACIVGQPQHLIELW